MKEEIRQQVAYYRRNISRSRFNEVIEVINSANGGEPNIDGQQQTKGSLQMRLHPGAGRKLKF
jgi:hypothetical protein